MPHRPAPGAGNRSRIRPKPVAWRLSRIVTATGDGGSILLQDGSFDPEMEMAMSTTLQAKDLTKEYPRSPLAELNGFPWLPRLIDKVRALKAGTLGAYTPFPCGGDRNFLATAGLDADALKAVIDSGASDEEIGAWAKAHAAPDAAEKLAAYKESQKQPVTGQYLEYLKEAIEELKKERPELDLSAVDNFGRLICVEEGHPLP